ncbi:hypothetical protein [Pseudomonas cremoricolorata]|uniref:Uncharacterized protein n=1 Tax=Pseudomonas cremoricolorata TaxID=157783 RepID=A0A089WIW1_9PSED|nr:hypothetical protein [Pseudomonas cremoricolorata]AIR89215.1 hypothetical protein LK03_07985 [Pseudomonas cremoricolorata]
MVRIRGQIGDWPVELTLELEPGEWAQLRGQIAPAEPEPEAQTPRPAIARGDDRTWEAAKAVLQQAGELDGPQLLQRLEALAGSEVAGKRLLVRLRHAAEVKVESAGDAPLYRWQGNAGQG